MGFNKRKMMDTAGYWLLRGRRLACRTTGECRPADARLAPRRRRDGPYALSCRSCRPNAPFAELVCLSKSSLVGEYYAERSGNGWVSE
jgi:hypothetical protein